MPTKRESDSSPKYRTLVERRSDRELVVERVLQGPARVVFEAWTKPELLLRWWAPRSLGVTLFECEADVRRGGTYRYAFGRDASRPMVFSGAYEEVSPFSRLVYTQIFEPMRQAGEARVTATFEEQEGATRLSVHTVYPSKEALDGAVSSGMERGARETMEQLEELVASESARRPPELAMTRTFDAPRAVVFEAWSKAEHVARWFTPRPLTTARCEVDCRVGGVFLVVMRMPNGAEHGFHGAFTDVVAPEHLAFVGKLDDGNEIATRVTFTEVSGRTTLAVHQTYSFESESTRGARQGWTATLDQLGRHLAR